MSNVAAVRSPARAGCGRCASRRSCSPPSARRGSLPAWPRGRCSRCAACWSPARAPCRRRRCSPRPASGRTSRCSASTRRACARASRRCRWSDAPRCTCCSPPPCGSRWNGAPPWRSWWPRAAAAACPRSWTPTGRSSPWRRAEEVDLPVLSGIRLGEAALGSSVGAGVGVAARGPRGARRALARALPRGVRGAARAGGPPAAAAGIAGPEFLLYLVSSPVPVRARGSLDERPAAVQPHGAGALVERGHPGRYSGTRLPRRGSRLPDEGGLKRWPPRSSSSASTSGRRRSAPSSARTATRGPWRSSASARPPRGACAAAWSSTSRAP